jgi:hypothetical protein
MIKFTPATLVSPSIGTRVDIWGPGAASLDVDYHLKPTSPCVNAGETSLLPADVADLDLDGNVTEALPYDLEGHPRLVGASVDVGAYEVQ